MKKTLIICLTALIFLSALSLPAANKKEMWMNAITEKDPTVKLQKLMEYKAEFDDPKDDNYLYLYSNLTLTSFQLKKFAESIEFGEKTLQIPNIQDNTKLTVYLILANAYNVTKQDYKKAAEYADMVVSTAQSLKQMTGDKPDEVSKMDAGYIAPALRIQASAFLQLGKTDQAMLLKASEKAIAAYGVDKAQTSLAFALTAAGSLANNKKFQEAISIIESIHKLREGTAQEYDNLAKMYNGLGNKDKMIENFEKAYGIKPNADTAEKLGRLLNKQNPTKAIEYLADVFAFTDSRESEAFKLLEHLYFNVVYKDKTAEDKDAGFKALLETAKGRIVK